MNNDLDFDKIPTTVLRLMEKLYKRRSHMGNILLAGGAPRDLLFGGTVTDWDFFVDVRDLPTFIESHKADVTTMLNLMGFNPVEICADVRKYADFDTLTYLDTNNTKLQFIYSDQTISDFDLSTCQISVDMEGNVNWTPAFETALKYSYHTVFLRSYKNAYQLRNGITSHIPRVLKKYPWLLTMDYAGADLNILESFMNRI